MADCNRNCCNDCGRERKYPCDTNFREAVCVHTDKIYDSCRDKDCLENVRVYLTSCGQDIVDRAINVKCTKAEVIWVFTDIEAVPFNRGFYSVDLKYFFKVTLAVLTEVELYAEMGKIKIRRSSNRYKYHHHLLQFC
jgi:hypothetical protein